MYWKGGVENHLIKRRKGNPSERALDQEKHGACREAATLASAGGLFPAEELCKTTGELSGLPELFPDYSGKLEPMDPCTHGQGRRNKKN